MKKRREEESREMKEGKREGERKGGQKKDNF